MLDITNPVWNNLNSNKDESIAFSQAVDNPGIPAQITQATTAKPISSDLVGLDDNIVKGEKYFNSGYDGFGGNGDTMGWTQRRPGEAYQTEDFDGGALPGNAGMSFGRNLIFIGKRIAQLIERMWPSEPSDDSPTNDYEPQTETQADDVLKADESMMKIVTKDSKPSARNVGPYGHRQTSFSNEKDTIVKNKDAKLVEERSNRIKLQKSDSLSKSEKR
jgi:hypothetical protein